MSKKNKAKILIATPANGLKMAYDLERSNMFPEKEGSYYIPQKYSKIIKKIEKFGLAVSNLNIVKDGEFSFTFKEKLSKQCDCENLKKIESFTEQFCRQIKFSKRNGTSNPEYDLVFGFEYVGPNPDRTDKDVFNRFMPLYLHDDIEWDIEKIVYKIEHLKSKKDSSKKKKKKK